ncbi:7707_t:CDS:1, partial [Gigaspora rosea]
MELEKHLDVSNFPALTHLMCSNNQITSLDLGENDTLGKIFLDDNKITANLDVFSHLTRLYEIKLGGNDFVGSLKCFENCKWLYHLSTTNNTKITEGLEYLPNKLERIQ